MSIVYNHNNITKEEVTDYLDELRDSGECNMLAAYAYVASHFNVTQRDAKTMCLEWMQEV